MGISRYLFNDWFTARELDELDKRNTFVQLATNARFHEQTKEIDDLRGDVAALALLARSLAELCIERGVLTQDDLKQRMLALDLTDGVADNRLDPKLATPGSAKPPPPPPKPRVIPPRKRP